MDVRLSPEQAALRDTAIQLVDRLGVGAVADLDDGDRRNRLESAVASAGWRELRQPDESGRAFASGVEVAIVAEELGRRLADVAFVGPVLATELRRLAGAPPATDRETVALDGNLSWLLRVGDGGPIDSRDGTALDADRPSTALALRASDDGAELMQLAIDSAAASTDLSRPVAAVAADDCWKPVDGAEPISTTDLVAAQALAITISCADLVGVMRGANALACDYARDRKQYGVAIGSFQAVQHLLADAHVAAEGATSATLYAAWAVDARDPDVASFAAATAKAYSARAARTVCETAIQVHGGVGNTWECIAHLYLRRALLSADLFGGVAASLDRVLATHGIPPLHPTDVGGSGNGLR